MKILGAGGVGAVLETCDPRFGIKMVSRSIDIDGAKSFWSSCKSIHAWTANIRFVSGCVKIPLAVRYWIHRKDAICVHEKCLDDLIYHRGRLGELDKKKELNPELSNVIPSHYILCSEQQLEEIYNNDLRGEIEDVRLLVTYPIQIGKTSVAKYIAAGGRFSEKEIYDAFYQILCSVKIIHQKGAHRDIKPDNILFNEVNGKKQFFLTDYDAFDSPYHTSYAATERFLPHKEICKELQKRFNHDDFSKMLDYFALAKTLLCMIDGTTVPNVMRKYKLPDEAKPLYEIDSFDPDKVRDIIADLEKKLDCCKQTYHYTPYHMDHIDFDEMEECPLGTLGTFHEQIRFSENFDAMIKNSTVNFRRLDVSDELFDVLLFPIAENSRNCYYHAPDNMYTGCRPINFWHYKPKSLSNTILSEEEQKSLIQKGKKLNDVLKQYKGNFFIPQKEHIVFIDGALKLFWGMGKRVTHAINYETYFHFLITNETDRFSIQDWIDFLPYCDELQDRLPQQTSLQLLERLDIDTVWLFNIKKFREQINGKTLDFSADCWLEICRYTDEFDQYIDSATAWKIFEIASGKQRGMLLERTKIREKLSVPPENFKMDDYLKAFFALRMYDENNFSRWFSQSDYEKFSAAQWESFLSVNPCLLKFMPKEYFQSLSCKAWVRISGTFPELTAECPVLDKLNAGEWVSILVQQPDLKRLVPDSIHFSEEQEKKINKK